MGRQGYIYLQKIGDLKNQQEMGLVDRFSEIFHVDIFGMNLFMARFAVEGSGMEIN